MWEDYKEEYHLRCRIMASSELAYRDGNEDFTLNDKFELPVDVQAVSVGGHAHYVCKKMHIVATLPDGERPTIYFDSWIFNSTIAGARFGLSISHKLTPSAREQRALEVIQLPMSGY